MKPEQILQSQFLDILFDNRNKEYGAYTLRKDYNLRLLKSLTAMILLAVGVCLFLKWKTQDNHFPVLLQSIYVDDVFLDKVHEEIIKPKEIKKEISSSPVNQSIEQIKSTAYAIVEDDLVKSKIPTQSDMDDKLIGTITTAGNPFEGVPTKPAEIVGKLNTVAPVDVKAPEILKPVFNAQIMPEFPGGKEGLMRYMIRNLNEPSNLQEGERFVVLVRFVVGIDGAITNAEIIKSGGDFDKNVLKVIRKMPKWKPGMQDGRAVPVYFQMPVTFEGREY